MALLVVASLDVQSRYRGVSDPDQAWVLRELIHYLSSEGSGAAGFEDMGEHWVPVRSAAHAGTLRQGDDSVLHVAERWEQFTEYLCLSLSQELGRNVTSLRPRKQTTNARLEEVAKSMAAEGLLLATIRVPDAVGNLRIRADLKSRQTSLSVDIAAPTEGRPKPRINWLLRQLNEAWPDLRVEVWYPRARESVAGTLEQAREHPGSLFFPADNKREPRSFVLTLSRPMGQKRGRADGSFVRETRAQTVAFYRDLVQNLKAWQARAPQIATDAPIVEDAAPPAQEAIPAPPPAELLSVPSANRMLPRTANGGVSNVDAVAQPASSNEHAVATEGSVQGSVLSKSAPSAPDPTPANMGDLT
jgi:hypothetical protein